ncbi:hypothetical protein [Yersinia enterocolitica]
MTKERAEIELKTKRDIRFFLWMNKNDIAIARFHELSSGAVHNANQIYGEDIRAAELAINAAFEAIYKDPAILSGYVRTLKIKQACFLPSKEFVWFNICQDSCYFVWTYVRVFLKENKFLLNATVPENFVVSTNTIYNRLELPRYPVTHQERVQSIVDFFDRIDLKLLAKMNLMSFIRNEWDQRYSIRNKPLLIKKDKQKCDWAWGYINKNKIKLAKAATIRTREKIALKKLEAEKEAAESNNNTPVDTPDSSDNNAQSAPTVSQNAYVGREIPMQSTSFLSLFRPVSTTEKYLTLNCIYFFLYHKDPNFLTRFTKAWESSSYRKAIKKNKNKKSSVFNSKSSEVKNKEEKSGMVLNANVENTISEKDEKRIRAAEIMLRITKNIDYLPPDKKTDDDAPAGNHLLDCC